MFKNLVGGQRVYFRQSAGIGLRGQEYKEASGKVNRLLIFENHVVVNVGGKYGNPQVVDESNFIRAGRVPRNAKQPSEMYKFI